MTSTVLVTGAGRRIGLDIARDLLDRGEAPVVHYHTHTDAVDDFRERDIPCVQGDFSSREGILEFIRELISSELRLDAIIHNASAYAPSPESLEAKAKQFELFFQVHMLAPYLINESLHDKLTATPEDPADIIHITDMYVNRPRPPIESYVATKAGLENLTKSLAGKYAPEVKVNAVAPGPVRFPEDADREYRRRVLEKTPLNREGGADCVLQALRAIRSNDFMTGSVLTVDGGRSLND